MSSDVSVKVENLSKCYQIYDRPRDRLKQFVMPRLHRNVGMQPRQYFREFWALKDVSLEVKKGETVGIIGRNGSGKSTLLQMICGTLNPTSGQIQTNGRIAALLELGSGFNPEFTGRENIHLNAAILGLSPEETEARFDDIAIFADIGDFLEQPVKSYSSGMVVRLAFAVQAMINPDILVVDEALAVGDEKFQRKCFARLEELKGRGTSILFVSHSAPSIIELCDRALLLDRGARIMYTSPQQAIRAYQKIIYAPDKEHQLLVESYRAADQSGEAPAVDGEFPVLEVSEKASDENAATFDPGLIPETTSIYPVQGAEIENIAIFDENDNAVNVLNPGSVYQFEISGKFIDSLPGVYFGIHIRNISGAVITGQRYPEEGSFVRAVRGGGEFKVRFSFNMSLISGVYFVGGGVWSAEEPTCAHRIMDAIMFRVLAAGKPSSFGYVNLSAGQPRLETA
ncbi:ABC transporter ATP-binding protein [Mesorhizobium sp. ESP6-5]|uniref:ABC transporter ATP-binding protein n=1 Tax=Mesorhizobium sp. ESP6-5 TaxID=2876623 RepID=UPI001CC9E269|nr:ABC transporter ATP-binding protein [Mesorhizobium sp. ESP6-5]MBZ9755788.1 ABC transporter ATP-binding protein [Mesorhizobium sp. ESP6-5]